MRAPVAVAFPGVQPVLRSLIVTIAVVASLAACGSQPKTLTTSTPPVQASVPRPNACSTLTRDEIIQTMGATVGQAQPGTGTPPTACAWDLVKPTKAGDGVRVEVHTVKEFNATLATRTNAPSARVYNIEPVSGIGDGAYFQSSTQAGTDAGVLMAVSQSGNAYFITVKDASKPASQIRMQERALAKFLAARV